ncbi:MAG TPA: hypothetical protein PLB38_01785 [bacterium]|nr:hypothetical protein [bacterium]
MKHLIGFGDDSLFVLSQIFQKSPVILRELEINAIVFNNTEYWFIPNFPQAKFVFLANGAPLEFIKNAPNLVLDHLSVIIQTMVMEYSFRNQTVDAVRARLADDIRSLENWLMTIMASRRDNVSFQFNKQKAKTEIKLNLVTNGEIPNIIGLSVDFHLPAEIYTILYDEMFVLSLEKTG